MINFKTIIKLTLSALIVVITVELSLIYLNYPILDYSSYYANITPGNFIVKDSILGYKHPPGVYNAAFSYNSIQMSIDEDGARKTSENEPQLHLSTDYYYGCSFTFGHGLNDQETFPWILQKENPHLKIKNFGVEGTGVLYAYLHLINLSKELVPDRLFYVYASFQNIRSTNSLIWQKQLFSLTNNGGEIFSLSKGGEKNYPRARLTTEGLKISYDNIFSEYSEKSIFQKLRITNIAENFCFQFKERSFYKSQEVNFLLLLKIKQICDKNKCEFIVLGIDNDEATREMLKSLTNAGINTLDISFDYHNEKYLLIDKFHPNAAANFEFFERINDVFYKIN